MRPLVWSLRILVFFFLLGFALKNDHLVTLEFFFDTAWRLPLIVVILAAFTGGVMLGVTATVITMLDQRREIRRLRASVGDAAMPRDTPSPIDYPRSV